MNRLPHSSLWSGQSLIATAVALALAACTATPVANIRRDADPRTLHIQAGGAPAASTTTPATGDTVVSGAQPLPADQATPRPQIRRGSGQVINREAAAAAPPALPATGGGATFNFEGESLQAVVKAILGDMLGQNYVIAPGVQ